jgi:tubulin-specific chaperone C
VADAADFVPAYDQRTYSQALKALSDQLNEATTKLAPKARFQFKARTTAVATAVTGSKGQDRRHVIGPTGNDTTSIISGAASEQRDTVSALPSSSTGKDYNKEIATTSSGVRKPSFSTARTVTLSDHEHLHIILPASAARATSAGALTNLRRCIVDMSVPTADLGAPFASLALKDISGSLIVAGRVQGPAHITGVRDSVIVVAARQVRIHECQNVDVYMFCGSHPVIEDCKGMRFAPVPECYVSLVCICYCVLRCGKEQG